MNASIWEIIERIGGGDEFTYKEISAANRALNPPTVDLATYVDLGEVTRRFNNYTDLREYKLRVIDVLNRRLNNRTHNYNQIELCPASDYVFPTYQSVSGIGHNDGDEFCEPFMEYGAHDYNFAIDRHGNRGWVNDQWSYFIGAEDQYVTQDYFERCYDTCNHCHERYHVDSDEACYSDETEESYCSFECRDEAEDAAGYRNIRNYSTKVEDVISFSLNPKIRYFGLEIEHEFRNERPRDAVEEAATLSPDLSEVSIWKEDGSLSSGAELVTIPRPIDYWRDTRNPISTLLEDARWRSIARSHNTTTCGLHIHVSRSTVPEPVIAKIVYLMNEPCMNETITLVARRSARHSYSCAKKKPWHSDINPRPAVDYIDDPSVPYQCYTTKPIPAWQRARPCASIQKRQLSTERYTPVNLTRHTLEFRIFKGTLKYSTILASIEFCDAVISYCTQYGASRMNDRDFTAWLKSAVTRKTYPALRDYLESRTILPTRKQKPADIVTPVTLSDLYGSVESTPINHETSTEWGPGAMAAFGHFKESRDSYFVRGIHWWATRSNIEAQGWSRGIPIVTEEGRAVTIPLICGQTWFSPDRSTSLTIREDA